MYKRMNGGVYRKGYKEMNKLKQKKRIKADEQRKKGYNNQGFDYA